MPRPSGIAFRLSQLGAHASARFAARLAELDLAPEHVGVLRIVGQQPGLSQQALAARLGALPSRIVKLVDELGDRGLVERRRSDTDRRTYELYVAAGAREQLGAVLSTVGDHDAELTRGLTSAEKKSLLELLDRVAHEQGLDDDVHPGHRQAPRS